MKSHKKFGADRSTRGFSLVEMLVVIAVVGVVSAIAVTSMNGIQPDARLQAAKQNAKVIVTTYQAATAAGAYSAPNGFGGLTSKTDLLNKLQAGVNGAGVFAAEVFAISDLDPNTQADAEAFLRYDAQLDSLLFDPNGVLP